MRLCPECKIPLETAYLEEENIDICTSCRGMFFEFDEMKTVLKNTLNEKFQNVYSGDKIPDHTWNYTCPKCGSDMKEEEYGFNSGIHIDRCHECMSIFLNGGESMEINRYLSSGEHNQTDEAKVAKIEAEYESKWKNIVQKMYEKMKQDGLI